MNRQGNYLIQMDLDTHKFLMKFLINTNQEVMPPLISILLGINRNIQVIKDQQKIS
jgi:hypothetical protein